MAALQSIWFWPSGGRVDDVDEAAFIRTAGRVGEAYSVAVAKRHFSASHSEFRCFAIHDPVASTARVHIHLDRPGEGYDSSTVMLPDGIVGLNSADRAALVVEVIHVALAGLSTSRGWDLATLEEARREVADLDGDFRWATQWKASPGRQWQARAHYRLDDNGDGWAHLEVAARQRADTRIWTSDEMASASSLEGFRKRMALHWTDVATARLLNEHQSVQVVAGGAVEAPPRFPKRVEAATDEQRVDSTPAPKPPVAVLVIPHGGTKADSPPEARLGGGGPTNHVPKAYLEAGFWLSHWIENNLLEWWSETGTHQWRNQWRFSPAPTTKAVVRLKGDRLTTYIQHPMPDPASEADPVGSAHARVAELLAAVRKRLNLPNPEPPLPPVDTVRSIVVGRVKRPSSGTG